MTDTKITDKFTAQTNGPSKDGVPESIFEPMNIPHSVSNDAHQLFETAFYIARGARSSTQNDDLVFLDQKIKEQPLNSALRVLLAATLEGAGELDGASEQYELAAQLASNTYEQAYLLERVAECAEKTGDSKKMIAANASAIHAYLAPNGVK
ncbi:MAG: hypothetical protein IT559_02355 [Alphaproteobacteria bacterium]|nr:hypothetical protein [Alphaproteobacteria bacterium]